MNNYLNDEPMEKAREALRKVWIDPDIRFGCSTPVEVTPIPIPAGFQPMEVHGPFLKRNRERAENKGGREAGVRCPKNAGEPHIWHKITRKRGGVTTKVNLCAKCKTRRLVSRDVVSACPEYSPIKKGRQSIERGGAQRWGCSNCGMAESSHIKALRPIDIAIANEIKARAEGMFHRRQA